MASTLNLFTKRAQIAEDAEPDVTDVSEDFPGAAKAERKGSNVLVLWKLDKPRESGDGEMCDYELSYKWLRGPSADLSQVMGSDVVLATKKEVAPVLAGGSLFDAFQLF